MRTFGLIFSVFVYHITRSNITALRDFQEYKFRDLSLCASGHAGSMFSLVPADFPIMKGIYNTAWEILEFVQCPLSKSNNIQWSPVSSPVLWDLHPLLPPAAPVSQDHRPLICLVKFRNRLTPCQFRAWQSSHPFTHLHRMEVSCLLSAAIRYTEPSSSPGLHN
jgi:hypothetical protein